MLRHWPFVRNNTQNLQYTEGAMSSVRCYLFGYWYFLALGIEVPHGYGPVNDKG
jgi:hypothetical protein